MSEDVPVTILDHEPDAPSVFLPGNMMDLCRQQNGLPLCRVPEGCLLDFDGEIVEHLTATGQARPDPTWPCFHTRLHRWESGQSEFGIIGGTIGAPFAVLVAEELFASGCKALVTIGSAGLLATDLRPPFFLLIERALRDEGTSYHYLAPAPFVEVDRNLLELAQARLNSADISVLTTSTWTTDAPFR
ncbi:hypothetical protein LCGC14_2088480, partial [marine sediment metagenome]